MSDIQALSDLPGVDAAIAAFFNHIAVANSFHVENDNVRTEWTGDLLSVANNYINHNKVGEFQRRRRVELFSIEGLPPELGLRVGMQGVIRVSSFIDDEVVIKFDEYLPGLDMWDNQLYMSFDGRSGNALVRGYFRVVDGSGNG